MNKNKLKSLLENTKKNLITAKEEYLFARGWIKIGKGHYTPNENTNIGCWSFGDKLFLNDALEVQEEIDRGL